MDIWSLIGWAIVVFVAYAIILYVIEVLSAIFKFLFEIFNAIINLFTGKESGKVGNRRRRSQGARSLFSNKESGKVVSEHSESHGWSGNFDVRLVEMEDAHVVGVEIRGPFPIKESRKIGFLTSILDVTNGIDGKPVISYLEFLQESATNFFQSYKELGFRKPGQGFSKWQSAGMFVPAMLQASRSGQRKLQIILRIVAADESIDSIVIGGELLDNDDELWTHTFEYEYEFEDKGYEETLESRQEAEEITIKLGVAVACSDGKFDNSEGEVIKKWMERAISGYSDHRKDECKTTFNEALKSSYKDHKSGTLSISKLSKRLNEIGEKKTKFSAMDLTYEIMSADGVADPKELKMLRELGESLELDMNVIERIRSRHIINLPDAFSKDDSLEQLLGIDESWDVEKIRKHLAQEFQRWNGRYNSLPEGKERENAQNMLNRIGEAREKYDAG